VAGHALESPVDLAMTQDGRTVFAAALDSNAVVVFARNRTTGALAEIGCVSQVDDSDDEDARDGCAHARPLDGANSVAVSPGGSALYVTHSAGLTIFARDRTTGALSRSACVTHRGYWDEETTAGCTLASGVADPSSVAVSRDGSNVYITAYGSDAITTFTRGVFVAQPAARISRRLLSVRVGCPGTHAGACAGRVVLTPPPALRRLRQSSAYRLEPGRSGTVHLHLRRDLVVASRRAPLAGGGVRERTQSTWLRLSGFWFCGALSRNRPRSLTESAAPRHSRRLNQPRGSVGCSRWRAALAARDRRTIRPLRSPSASRAGR